jgi:hypothetical protein
MSAQVFTDAELLEAEEHDLQVTCLMLGAMARTQLDRPRTTTAPMTDRARLLVDAVGRVGAIIGDLDA